MIKSTGADYVIIGHSERRSYYNEDNELLATKTREAINKELRVIFCCGEVLSERENNNHFSVVQDQIEKGLRLVNNSDLDKLVIAYEPVWAIGTGVTASSEQAQEMHAFIRELIGKLFGPEQADKQVILYGGSCKPGNAKELFAMPDVDGGLIGGASLNAGDFTAIIKSFS